MLYTHYKKTKYILFFNLLFGFLFLFPFNALAQTEDFIPWIIEIAEGEIGYTEEADNYTKYGQWYGDPNANWCAEFLGWVINEVDKQKGTNLLNIVYPKYSGQNTGKNWFLNNQRFIFKNGIRDGWGEQWSTATGQNFSITPYIPVAGDWIFFSYNSNEDTVHVALVTSTTTDKQGEVFINVIEGNLPDKVQRATYALNDDTILGYGVPTLNVGTAMVYGSHGTMVTDLQKKLFELNYLDERHITGMLSANTENAIKDFQTDYMKQITATGVADQQTQEAINSAHKIYLLQIPTTWLVVEKE